MAADLLLAGRAGTVGRPAEDNRRFVHGVLWVLRSGMRWQDLPERFGKYKSVHKRFTRWAEAGVWDRIFADLLKDRENRYVMIDSSVERAHQQAPAVGRSAARSRDRRQGLRYRPDPEPFGRTRHRCRHPPRVIRKIQRGFDRALYRQRKRIERTSSHLKQFRRLATRFDKLSKTSAPPSPSPAPGAGSPNMSMHLSA